MGYVYMLANSAMPGIYKIGCSEYHPSIRMAQLSSGSGVPMPFELVCFCETPHFKKAERAMHNAFSHGRINKNREFFKGDAAYLVGWFLHCGYFTAFVEGPALKEYVKVPLGELDDWVRIWRDYRDDGVLTA